MIPAEQWQKEYPELTEDLILRIQRDAWKQGIEDSVEVAMDIQTTQLFHSARKSDAANIVEWAIRDLLKKPPL